MASSDEALQAVHEWERQHGHSAESASLAARYGGPVFAPDLPRLSRAQILEGAGFYDDYQRARRAEDHARRIAQTERDELFTDEILRRLSR